MRRTARALAAAVLAAGALGTAIPAASADPVGTTPVTCGATAVTAPPTVDASSPVDGTCPAAPGAQGRTGSAAPSMPRADADADGSTSTGVGPGTAVGTDLGPGTAAGTDLGPGTAVGTDLGPGTAAGTDLGPDTAVGDTRPCAGAQSCGESEDQGRGSDGQGKEAESQGQKAESQGQKGESQGQGGYDRDQGGDGQGWGGDGQGWECDAPRGASCADGPDCAKSPTGSTCGPAVIQRGVDAGEGGAFNGSVPALVTGGLLIAGALGAAAHRLVTRG
ncbi:hypothetical protein [Streptomyces sp. NPDC058964]|uniref:hypothetical protein n=1 Tax=Streptomyces sp. NPDC058964 TaxID=3346681 RepID=UPI0036A5B05B